MPTVVTKSIGTSGRDYSTIASWFAACPADLVADDKVWRGECYNDSEFTGQVTFSGITTDATRYVELTCATGESAFEHGSVRSNPLVYDQSKGVGINNTTSESWGIYSSNVANLRISLIQFKIDTYYGVILSTTGNIVRDCLIQHEIGTIAFEITGGTVVNVLVVCMQNAGSPIAFQADGYTEFIQCGAVAPSDLAAGFIGFYASAGAPKLVSSYAFNFGSFPSFGSFDGGSGNNATDHTSIAGSSNQTSVTFSQSTPFEDADSGSMDFRAIASTALDGNGAYDGTNAPNDISGTARANPSTIGPWEISSGSSPQTIDADAAVVTVSAPAATVVPGAATVSATAATVMVTAPDATLVPGAATISATAATVTVTAPGATVVPGAATISATAATVTVSAPDATITSGATISATAAVVTVTAPDATVVSGASTIPASAATVTVTAPSATLVPGAATIAANAAVVTVTAPDAELIVGALPASAAVVTVTAPDATLQASAVLSATAAVVQVSAPTATATGGAVTIGATACVVTVTAPVAVLAQGASVQVLRIELRGSVNTRFPLIGSFDAVRTLRGSA